MTAAPAAMPVTFPFSTVAFAASDVDQTMTLFVASSGATLAARVSFAPTATEVEVLLSVTPDTAITLGVAYQILPVHQQYP